MKSYVPGHTSQETSKRVLQERDEPKSVQELIQHYQKAKIPYLIGCDANAHHTVWGSTDINDRGELILDFLLNENVKILNKGNRLPFINAIRAEVLDLTLSSANLADFIVGWHVSDELTTSDHMQIRFDLSNEYHLECRRLNKRLVNWVKYSEIVADRAKELPPAIESTSDLEQVATQLTEIVISAYEGCSKVITNQSARKVPWWNKELAVQRKWIRKLFNRARRSHLWEEYKRELCRYDNMIRDAKTNSWRKFCGDLKEIPEAARLRKLLAKDGTNGVGTLLKQDGSHTADRKETWSTSFKGLRVSRYREPCPTAALEAILGLTPLHMHIKGTAASSALMSVNMVHRRIQNK